MKICPAVPRRRTDGQTDMMKLTVTFRNFVNAPKKMASQTLAVMNCECQMAEKLHYVFQEFQQEATACGHKNCCVSLYIECSVD
jgi:hypothetical protein